MLNPPSIAAMGISSPSSDSSATLSKSMTDARTQNHALVKVNLQMQEDGMYCRNYLSGLI